MSQADLAGKKAQMTSQILQPPGFNSNSTVGFKECLKAGKNCMVDIAALLIPQKMI